MDSVGAVRRIRVVARPSSVLPRPLLGGLIGLLALGLAAFHLGLLHRRLVAGEMLEPAVGLRWCAGLMLLAGLARLARMGVRSLTGREALALWLLLVPLHWNTASVSVETQSTERGAPLLFLVPAAAVALTVGTLCLAARSRVASAAHGASTANRVSPHAEGPLASGCLQDLSPRAPPAIV
jgi:hypothetical protein